MHFVNRQERTGGFRLELTVEILIAKATPHV